MKNYRLLATVALASLSLFGGMASATTNHTSHSVSKPSHNEKIKSMTVSLIPMDDSGDVNASLVKAGFADVVQSKTFYRANSQKMKEKDFNNAPVSLASVSAVYELNNKDSIIPFPFSITETQGYIKEISNNGVPEGGVEATEVDQNAGQKYTKSVIENKTKSGQVTKEVIPGYMKTGINGTISVNEKNEIGLRVTATDGYIKDTNLGIQLPVTHTSYFALHTEILHGKHNSIAVGPIVKYEGETPKNYLIVITANK